MAERVDTDVVGIGFGPANIALAIAMEELRPELRAIFLDRQPGPGWQSGMLLDGSDIQHHPVRDLVTPRNPRSRYSFLNYLVEEDRLFPFLNLGIPYPLRKDYARYVVWAAEQFADQVDYGATVDRLEVVDDDDPIVIARCADGRLVRARAAVVAPGRAPLVPAPFRTVNDDRVFHFTSYLDHAATLAARRPLRLVVVGGSQSAVELVLDAMQRFPDAEIANVMRGFGYRQKDLSPFTNEVYFPSFVDHYYAVPEPAKRDLDRQLRYTNYSAADSDVLHQLYVRLYEQRLDGTQRVRLHRDTEVVSCTCEPDQVRLELLDRHQGEQSVLTADAVVLATGFVDLTDERGGQFLPAVLDPARDRVARTASGRAEVGRDYRLGGAPGGQLPPIYLNGLCETTHGMGDAGSFSLLSLRAATIVESLAKALAPLEQGPHAGRSDAPERSPEPGTGEGIPR